MGTTPTTPAPTLVLLLLFSGGVFVQEALGSRTTAQQTAAVREISRMSEEVAEFLPEMQRIEDEVISTKENWQDLFQDDYCSAPMAQLQHLRLEADMALATADHVKSEIEAMTDIDMALASYTQVLEASITARLSKMDASSLFERVKDSMFTGLESLLMSQADADKVTAMSTACESHLTEATSLGNYIKDLVQREESEVKEAMEGTGGTKDMAEMEVMESTVEMGVMGSTVDTEDAEDEKDTESTEDKSEMVDMENTKGKEDEKDTENEMDTDDDKEDPGRKKGTEVRKDKSGKKLKKVVKDKKDKEDKKGSNKAEDGKDAESTQIKEDKASMSQYQALLLPIEMAEVKLKHLEENCASIKGSAQKLVSLVAELPEYIVKQQLEDCFGDIVKETERIFKKVQEARDMAKSMVEKLGQAAGVELPSWFYDDVLDVGEVEIDGDGDGDGYADKIMDGRARGKLNRLHGKWWGNWGWSYYG